jgi:ABC-type antimicrobial peptide transport system permease subunit
VLLVRCAAGEEKAVADLVRLALGDLGVEVTETRVRVARALGVENTYLTVFQALGGLGLVLGTVGLGVVLLRGVWERRKELALLGAIGYRPGDIGQLLLIETLVLLLGGLGLGVVCALVSVLPHAANLAENWQGLGLQVLACVGTGLVAGAFACRAAMRVPLLSGLRSE